MSAVQCSGFIAQEDLQILLPDNTYFRKKSAVDTTNDCDKQEFPESPPFMVTGQNQAVKSCWVQIILAEHGPVHVTTPVQYTQHTPQASLRRYLLSGRHSTNIKESVKKFAITARIRLPLWPVTRLWRINCSVWTVSLLLHSQCCRWYAKPEPDLIFGPLCDMSPRFCQLIPKRHHSPNPAVSICCVAMYAPTLPLPLYQNITMQN